MAEVLAFSCTAIGDWVPNLLISLWARVVLVGVLQYLVFRQETKFSFGTRAFSILPMSKLDLPPYKVVYCCHVGFGFDLQSKSIKVVKVANLHSDEARDYQYINRVEVYDLVSGSWRVLHLDNTLQQVFVSDEPNHGMYNNNDGVFHWHSYRKSRGNIRHHSLVLSFDMSRELFHVTRMPKKYNAFRTFFHFSLLRDSLAVNFSLLKAGHESIAIWVMKKNFYCRVVAGESFSSYSWYDELTVDLPYSHPCLSTGFWNKNELLLWNIDDELMLRTPVLYDIVTKQAMDLGELNFTNKESLVLVKGGCGNNFIP
ncbi:hypothetical protein Vadar_023430 [Vaccinium darrowii]|uniref:Uncharacterized protein n=1 Tax=Vaccinium darrowii TaxID=229202 RepID=A0ACB7Y2J7_9ERIC|nr:hypothetical protein Vadar_023430 [Vaccinium darrowii]